MAITSTFVGEVADGTNDTTYTIIAATPPAADIVFLNVSNTEAADGAQIPTSITGTNGWKSFVSTKPL